LDGKYRAKAMDEFVNVKNKKKTHQKPPRSLRMIACEILAGVIAGLAVAVPVVYVLAARSGGDCFGVGKLIAAAAGFLIVPPVYVLGTVVGVYLVGSRDNQAGSFLATLGGAFLGVPIIALLYLNGDMAGGMMFGIVKIVLWLFAFFVVPIMATLCFNLTRRYKEPLSS